VNPEGSEPLSFDDAFAAISGGDPRPILLLRDCAHSEKDLTKISTFTDDERVALGMSWYRLVRVHKNVVNRNHPLHALVGDRNAHMVIFTNEGKKRVDLALMPSSNDLWQQITRALKDDYKKSAEEAVAKWRTILTAFDKLDVESARIKGENYRKGGDPDLERKIEDLDAQKQVLVSQETKLKNLEAKNPKKTPATPSTTKDWRDEVFGGTASKPAGG
jgi:BMFP domain-containing protein YqiC